MKIAYKYIIRNYLGPLLLTFLVALFILLMQFLWKYVDDLVGKGLEIHIILQFMFYAAGTMMNMALPLAVLLASLMTFGNMGERLEIVALKSAGVSISQMMRPLAFFTFLIAVFAFWYSDVVSPKAQLKLRTLLYSVQEQKPALSIDEGVFYNGFEGYTIRVGHKKRDNETIEDVLVYDHSRHQGNVTMTYAKKGTMRMTDDENYLLLTLYDGYFWDESVNAESGFAEGPLNRATFSEQYKRFDLSSFQLGKSDESFFANSQMTLPLRELGNQIDTLEQDIVEMKSASARGFFDNLYYYNQFIKQAKGDSSGNDITVEPVNVNLTDLEKQQVFNFATISSEAFVNSAHFALQDTEFRKLSLYSYQAEYHIKFTYALACLLFFFIGAPLGSIIRKGGIGIPLVITVGFFTFFFILSVVGKNLALSGKVPVLLAMWMPTIVLLPICAFLTYKATIDSALFSQEVYAQFFKKIFAKFKKRKK